MELTVGKLVDRLGLEVTAGADGLERKITGGYCGDLLSDVMARAKPNDLWVTIQGHQNVVAVAVLTEVAAVVVCGSVRPEEATIERADREGIPILRTEMTTYEVSGRLFALLEGAA